MCALERARDLKQACCGRVDVGQRRPGGTSMRELGEIEARCTARPRCWVCCCCFPPWDVRRTPPVGRPRKLWRYFESPLSVHRVGTQGRSLPPFEPDFSSSGVGGRVLPHGLLISVASLPSSPLGSVCFGVQRIKESDQGVR